ncbi:MAG: AAA family ATPase, partial [Anaerotignum sp.]|nr:AAA family ATPase [Anaerotignum sp.]
MRVEKVEPMNISQAKKSILQAMKLYFKKGEDGGYSMDRRRARPICLMGPTGIGKTEIVCQAAQEMGIPLLSYSITHHTRQSLIGLPRLAEQEIEGQLVSVTEYTMSEVISEMYRVMKETGKAEGILFLDEFNCASDSVWPVMLQLLQEKTLGNHALPEGWMLVLAGNPVEYNAGATELDTVIADRLRMVWIE